MLAPVVYQHLLQGIDREGEKGMEEEIKRPRGGGEGERDVRDNNVFK